jgi:serine/threonine-protein kinase RsbT
MTPTYRNTLAVLTRYVSRVNAQVALSLALKRAGMTPENIGPNDIERLLPHLEGSLNLFIERSQLPKLFAELGRQSEPANFTKKMISIDVEADVSEARLQARQLCLDMGASMMSTQKVATLVSELARNIFLYAQRGRIEIIPELDRGKRIIIKASDAGPGIPNLQQIMAGDYKSKTGLGMGLRGSKRLANRFEIESGTWGTRIEAEINL